MIEVKENGQVLVKLGFGDVGYTVAVDGEERSGFLCFEQLDRSYPNGTDLFLDGYHDIADWSIDKQNVVVKFKEDTIEDTVDSIDELIFFLQMLKEGVLNNFQWNEDINNMVKTFHDNHNKQ